jgi:hypothetical protein
VLTHAGKWLRSNRGPADCIMNIENNNLGFGRPFCIRFWETENNILVFFFGFEIGHFFWLTKIVRV